MPGGELSEAQRVYILAQADADVSTREISETLGCTQRAVQKIIARWKSTTHHTRNDRMGRPPILTSRDHRRLLIIVKRDPTIEYSTLRTAAGLDGDETTPPVSFRTIARALASTNYSKYRAARRPKINANTAKLRYNWALQWANFDWDHTTLKFSDECSIARGSGRNPRWVWRLPTDKWRHEMVEEIGTSRQPARMVWASIWMTPGGGIGRSPLVIMARDASARRNGYTSLSYTMALEEGLRNKYRPGELFMQDNAPIHTAHCSREWLELHGVHTIDWPPYSPDLNLIEHLWWALKKQLHKLKPYLDNIGDSDSEWVEFELGLKEAWAAIPEKLVRDLITSMPRRINAVLQAKGYQTRY